MQYKLASHPWVTTVLLAYIGEFRNIEDFKYFVMAKNFMAKSIIEIENRFLAAPFSISANIFHMQVHFAPNSIVFQHCTVYDQNNGIFRRRHFVRYSSKTAKIPLKYFIRQSLEVAISFVILVKFVILVSVVLVVDCTYVLKGLGNQSWVLN